MGKTLPPEEKKELVTRICGMIIQDSVERACRECGIAEGTFFGWLAADDELAEEYARARKAIAYKNEMEIENVAHQARDGQMPSDVARVVIDAKKWLAGKRNALVYGEQSKLDITSKGKEIGQPVTPEAIAEAALLLNKKLEGNG